jgi:signal transduction histidine kinase/DNA-binding response OmpR family regulator/ligand-binding sensor domain-containing protein
LPNPTLLTLLFLVFFVHHNEIYGQLIRETSLRDTQGELRRRRYTKDDGLPVNALASLAFGPDSTLYIATYDGLTRFNGFRFEVLNSLNTPGLDAERFAFITALPKQKLLAGSEDGRYYLIDRGRAKQITFPDDPEHLTFILGSGWRDSTLTFISRTSLFSVSLLKPDTPEVLFTAKADSLINVSVISSSQFWITARSGLFLWDSDRVKHFIPWTRLPVVHTYFPVEVRALPNGDFVAFTVGAVFTINGRSGTPEHRFLVAKTSGRNEHFRDVKSQPSGGIIARSLHADYYLSADLTLDSVFTLKPYIDRFFSEVHLDQWAGKPLHVGFHAVYWGEEVLFKDKNPFQVKAVLAEPKGDLWIATASEGLLRFSRNPFGSISAKHGLPGQNLYSIRPMNDGAILAASLDAGPLLIKGKIVKSWPSHPGGVLARSVLNLKDGTLLSGHYSSILWASDGKTPWSMPSGINDFVEAGANAAEALFESTDGTVWIGTRSRLGRRKARAPNFVEVRDLQGRTVPKVRNILETPQGDLLFLTAGNGLLLSGRDSLPVPFMKNAPPLRHLRDVWFRTPTEWWGASETHGLVRFSPGDSTSIRTISISEGLPDNTLHRLIPDNNGRLWATTNRGLLCFSLESLDRYQQELGNLQFASFSTEDGLSDAEFNGGTSDAGFTAPDGKIWLPNQKGLVFFHPDSVIAQRNASRLLLKASFLETGGRKIFDAGAGFSLESGERNVVFHFEAINLSATSTAAFEYRIDAKKWLPLGKQTFLVLASLTSGEHRITIREIGNYWNPATLETSIFVKPLFYETPAFRSLAIFAILLIIAGTFQSARLINRHREKRLQQLVESRTKDLQLQRKETEEALQTVREQASRLEEFNRYRTDLFLGFTHELRTPLALITGPLEHLSQVSSNLSSENASIQLGIVRRNAAELQKLVNRILFLINISEKDPVDASETVRLDDVVESVTAPFRDRTLYSSYVLHLECERPLGSIRSEKAALELILSNLISNAFKYGNGSVSLGIQRNKETVQFYVHNGGEPIPEKDLPKLFEPFFRGVQHESISGSGMGLPIVERLVARLGGNINVVSSHSSGSTFTVTLPALWVEESQPEPVPDILFQPVSEDGKDSGRHRLLIVDDNADFRTLLQHALERDYQLTFAPDGIQAAALFADAPHDLIISDVMMPGLDGFGLAESIRATSAGKNLPFIFLTANDRPEALARGLALGADAFLTKPVSLELLKAHITALLERKNRLADDKKTATTPTHPIVLQIDELIVRHMANPALSVESIAAQLNMSRPTLFRAWQKTGLPPISQRIIAKRLSFAMELVTRNGLSLTQAALTCGFNDAAYFSRIFKKTYGCTPSEWLHSDRSSGIATP